MIEQTAAAYDQAGPSYREWKWSQFWDTYETPAVLDRLPSFGAVLDAGCGYGRYAAPIRNRGLSYDGCDVSVNQLKLAISSGLPVEVFRVGDICRLPYRRETFDTVICNRVLNHGVSLKAAASEFARVAKPGATLLITDIAESHRYSRATIPCQNNVIDLPLKRYALSELHSALTKAGWRIVTSERLLIENGLRAALDLTVCEKLTAL